MAADKAKGSSAFRMAPFVDPANRKILTFDDRVHNWPCFGEKAELEVVLLAQVEITPTSTDRVLGIGLAQSGSLHQVPGKAVAFGIEPAAHGLQPRPTFGRLGARAPMNRRDAN